MDALEKEGINEIVDWSFYPDPDGDGNSPYDCAKAGQDKADCEIDRIEGCLVKELCWWGSTAGNPCDTDPAKQLTQAKFVMCMESTHDSKSPSYGKKCASTAGLSDADWAAVEKCASGDGAVPILDAIAKHSKKINVKFFPDVRINGGKPLPNPTKVLQAICKAYTGKKPAGCASA